jgi:phytoene dehydrogenase-like protein
VSDVVIIGAGPNGLVAANILTDAGLEVVVCEEQPAPGGAVRSGELTLPGYEHDLFSAFYPFAVASPPIRRLELERWGLRWRRAPLALANPTAAGPTVVLSQDIDETAASLDAFAPGDGDAWRRLYGLWRRIEEPFMEAFTTPFPPVAAAAQIVSRLRVRGAVEFAQLAVRPLRRLAAESFRGAGGGLLIGANALHADLTPDMRGSALPGLILCGLGQHRGYPVPEGGAGRLTDALVARLSAAGGTLHCGSRVERLLVRGGRAVGVRLAGGRALTARVGVLADVGAPQLYSELLGRDVVPARIHRRLRRFRYDHATVKVDWALSSPVPWRSDPVHRAGTVHVAESLEQLSAAAEALECGVVPDRPFLLFGQYAVADSTRAPAGHDTAWAYTHVPQSTRGAWDEAALAGFARRIEDEIERLAPGFRERILGRSVFGPHELEQRDRNLVGGAVNGGTAQWRQELMFRPVIGLGRPETPIDGLLLASASAHPGGGVHGAPGAIAARALLRRAHRRHIFAAPGSIACRIRG